VNFTKDHDFYRALLHGMQTRSSDESCDLSVCPSVCLSIKRVN